MDDQPVEEPELGNWFKVRGFVPGEQVVFPIVPESKADCFKHEISLNGSVGRALIGAKAGDKVIVHDLDNMELSIVETGHG